jgi:integrase
VGPRLKTAIKKANPILEKKGIEPISERVSPHSLRRTFASLRYACGDDPVYVAEQGSWTDPSFPIRVYARAVHRKEKLTGSHREAFDAAIEWALLGTNAEDVPSEPVSSDGSGPRKRLSRAIN